MDTKDIDYEDLGSLLRHFPTIKVSQDMPQVTLKETLTEKNLHKYASTIA